MKHWLQQLHTVQENLSENELAILISVARVRGSAPRDIGARMIVSQTQCWGTIGGGELEHQCQQRALQMLKTVNTAPTELRNFPLGSNCGQCCGGVVDVLFEQVQKQPSEWQRQAMEALDNNGSALIVTPLWGADETQTQTICLQLDDGVNPSVDPPHEPCLIEKISPPATHIALFGAGHVGQAVVNALAELDCQITWIDSRQEFAPPDSRSNINVICVADPARLANSLPAGSLCLVMTHNHALDFDICAQLLVRPDIEFCGLIGSASKRARFERLFKQAGLDPAVINKLTCPIGIEGINGKRPAEIAVSVAAQILQQSVPSSQLQSQSQEEPPSAAVHH